MIFAIITLFGTPIAETTKLDLMPLTDELRQSISSILESIDNVQERLTRIEMATEGLTKSFDRMAEDYASYEILH